MAPLDVTVGGQLAILLGGSCKHDWVLGLQSKGKSPRALSAPPALAACRATHGCAALISSRHSLLLPRDPCCDCSRHGTPALTPGVCMQQAEVPQIDLPPLCMLLAPDKRHPLMLLLCMHRAETHDSSAYSFSSACSHLWGTSRNHQHFCVCSW